MNPLLHLMDRCHQLGVRLKPAEYARIEYGGDVLVVVDLPAEENKKRCAHRLFYPDDKFHDVLSSILFYKTFRNTKP